MTNKSREERQVLSERGRMGGKVGGKARVRKGFGTLGSDAARHAQAKGAAARRENETPLGFAVMSPEQRHAAQAKSLATRRRNRLRKDLAATD